MRTVVISDLHLGSGNDEDVCRSPAAMERLIAALDGSDRLVLLGDILELRDRPLPEALERSTPVLGELAEAMRDGEVVFVPGNHDHHVLATWLEDRRLAAEGDLGLEHISGPAGSLATAVANACAATSFCFAYPGAVAARRRLRDTWPLPGPPSHGADVRAPRRRRGRASPRDQPGAGPDPLEAPDDRMPASPEEYERALAPVYELSSPWHRPEPVVTPGAPRPGSGRALGGGESRAARLRGWLLGSVALPGAVGVANRLGLGPVRSDLSAGRDRQGWGRCDGRRDPESPRRRRLRDLRPHPPPRATPRRVGLAGGRHHILNTGSWVLPHGLLGHTSESSPYWPGTVAIVEAKGRPASSISSTTSPATSWPSSPWPAEQGEPAHARPASSIFARLAGGAEVITQVLETDGNFHA